MWEIIKSNVLAPAATRLGSFASGGLMAVGANADHAQQVGLGIAAAVLIGLDLGLAYLRKRIIINKTFADTVEGIVNGKVR